MKKNIKNQAGFTLVELIVVMTIFAIIMGAILNLIQPANKAYNNAEAIMETNVTGSATLDYLDENLKYATNVLILQNYAGVPEVSSTGTLGGSSIEYKNCIIIDNNNLRGYSTVDYSGSDTDTAQKRMGCTGCIINVSKLNEGGLNLDNSAVALGVDNYGKFTFDIQAELSNIDNMYTLDVSLDAYEPTYSGGTYTFTKTKYTAECSVNLVNINMDTGDSFRVQDCIDFASTPDYTTYPQASASTATTTSQQSAYYSTDASNTYTYIFYDKKDVADTLKYDITFKYSSSSPISPDTDIFTTQALPGASLQSAVPTLSTPSGYYAGYWKDSTGTVVDFSTYVVTGDETFTAYFDVLPGVTFHTVKFYNADGTLMVETSNTMDGDYAINPGTPLGYDSNLYDFTDWVTKDTNVSISSTPITTDTVEFIPLFTEKCKVEFMIDGAIDDTLTTYVSVGSTATSPSTTPTAPTAGDVFDNWYLSGTYGTSNPITINSYGLVTSDVVFEAQFKTPPAVADNEMIIHYVYTTNTYKTVHIQTNSGSIDNVPGYAKDFYASEDITVKFNSDNAVLHIWPKNCTSDITSDIPYDSSIPNILTSANFGICGWGEYHITTADVTAGLHEIWIKDGRVYNSDPG